jgi:putative membrane protein
MNTHRFGIACAAALISSAAVLAAAAAPAPAINDAQIAAIVVTANQVDIDIAKLALEKSTNAEVKKLAMLMVTDHTAANTAATNLAGRLHLTPESNATSEALGTQGKEALERLKGLSGAAFDSAYVEREVAYHKQVIAAMDSTLIPGAKNADLKGLLVKVRPNFQSHLEHAQHVQGELKSR